VSNSRKVNVTLSNEDGDEVTGQLSVRLPPPVKLQSWIRIFERGLLMLSKMDLTAREYKMLLFILARTDFNNQWWCESALCFACTGIGQNHHAKIICSLVSRGLLMPHSKIGRKQVFSLNKAMAWKGNAQFYTQDTSVGRSVWDLRGDFNVTSLATGEVHNLTDVNLHILPELFEQ